jgi:limonene-1,2-epoxide hydrolase
MGDAATRSLIEAYWAAMQRNDWDGAAALLADDAVLAWPQSGERVRGPADFVAVNRHYPSAGAWRFEVRRIVAEASAAASEVTVTDGARRDRAVTFFEVDDGRIVRMVEFWPDPFPAAAWRAAWVERIADDGDGDGG